MQRWTWDGDGSPGKTEKNVRPTANQVTVIATKGKNYSFEEAEREI